MTALRTAAQQALEALTNCSSEYGHRCNRCDSEVDEGGKVAAALRAALAQQKDPTDPGNDVDVLREHVRHLERRVRQLHAQQAKPVAGVVLNEEGRAALVEHGREEWHCVSRNARRLYTAPPQRKPLTEEVAALTAQRDALLEALRGLMQQYKDQPECFMDWSKARAAIKAVEDTK